MTAADLLRTALDAAPAGLHVAEDGHRNLALFDGIHLLLPDEEQAALRLIGLLLAAAPHLADLLDLCESTGLIHDRVPSDLVRAITEAGESR